MLKNSAQKSPFAAHMKGNQEVKWVLLGKNEPLATARWHLILEGGKLQMDFLLKRSHCSIYSYMLTQAVMLQ